MSSDSLKNFLIIFLIIILIAVIVYIIKMNFFNNTKEQFNSPIPINHKNLHKPSVYVFVSKTCPACVSYKQGNKMEVEKVVKELGLELNEVDVNSNLDNATQDIYKKCNVQYIPTACLVKPSGEIKQLGNGNALNKNIIMSSL